MTTEPDSVEQLRASLSAAVDAANDAYRHSTQLIRVLTVLGQPSTPEELVEQTLIVLAQVFTADIAAVAQVSGGRVIATSAFGLAEDDPVYREGWPAAGGLLTALGETRAVERSGDALGADDIPESLAELHLRSVVWIPLADGPESGEEILLLFRRTDRPLSLTELQVLQSVAFRLRTAVESRERSIAVERLARSGHRLAEYLDLSALTDAAVQLLPYLMQAEIAHLLVLDGKRVVRHVRSDGHSVSSQRCPADATELPGWAEVAGGEPFRGPCTGRFCPADDTAGTAGTTGGGQGGPARVFLCAPVMREEEPVALLYVIRHGRHPFPPDAAEIASVFANYLNVAMMNADLYRQLRTNEAALRQRATHDPLTGLANRELIYQRLEQTLDSDDQYHVGLLFCDLDRFKQVNDRLGHEAGDDLLLAVAARLHRGLRPTDLLARFGGDEFVVLLDGIDSLSTVQAVGRRMIESLEMPFSLQGERVKISACIGGVLGKRGQHTASEMLRDADAAMYSAKRRGSGLVVVFDDVASTHSLDSLELHSELGSALARDQLWLQYQPIYDLRSDQLRGFEALLRWTHPERGGISPEVFIPLAEESGSIIAIGDWAVGEACRQLATWHELAGDDELEISVNLSPIQLRHPAFVGRTLAAIAEAGVPPRSVLLEITERGPVDAEVARSAAELHDAGVRFALDDFGIAHSNLDHLKQLPIDQIKIDRSFVDGMLVRDMDRAIVHAVLAIASSLNLSVVAEGIETVEQRESLLGFGCWHGQGYLLSRPISALDATALLRSARQPDTTPYVAGIGNPGENSVSNPDQQAVAGLEASKDADHSLGNAAGDRDSGG